MAVASVKSIKRHNKEQDSLKRGAKKAYQQVAENIILLGKCGNCKGDLIYYVKSEKQNLFNYYCIGDGDKKICTEKYVRDVRFPFGKDYFLDGQNPLTMVMQINKEINDYVISEEEMEQSLSEIACKES